jgi:predicted nucleic acid-binding protein
MQVVIDANELFSLLIRGGKKSLEIMFSDEIEIIAPEFLLIEFSAHKREILSKTHRTDEEFCRLLEVFNRRIKLAPREEFDECLSEALKLLPAHTKDAPYLALSLKYNACIWSEDKELKKQNKVNVYTTEELHKKLI